MLRYLFVPLMVLPVGWCDPESPGLIWKNRRGGRVVFLGDVFANFSEAFQAVAFRLPEGTEYLRGPDGKLIGTITRPGRRNRRDPRD